MEEPYIVCIAAGASHSLALTDCGIVASWGKGEDGQLGHGSSAEVSSPQAVSSLLGKDICIVRCGAEYSLAVSKAHEVWSWGWGDFGRLGHGNTTDQFLPKPITFFSGMIIKEVTCGDTHTLVVTDMGELFTFGRNQNGQLGLGHTEDQLSPQRVEALQGHCVASVAGGAEHSIAATSQGKVFGWGWGRYGNLGTGQLEDKLVPTPAIALDAVHISKVNCGWRHSVAVSNHGVLYAFGWGKYGQLGHGDNTDQPTATPVAALQGKVVVEVVGGWRHTLATDSSGSLWGWGWNKFGQLGLGDTVDRNTPCLVASLDGSGISLLASGWRHSLAVTQAGAVYSWGRGVNGQLGLREEEDRYQPTLLPSLSRGQLRREQLLATAQLRCHSMELADRYAVVPGADGQPHICSDSGFLPRPLPPNVLPSMLADEQGIEERGSGGVISGLEDTAVPEVPELSAAETVAEESMGLGRNLQGGLGQGQGQGRLGWQGHPGQVWGEGRQGVPGKKARLVEGAASASHVPS